MTTHLESPAPTPTAPRRPSRGRLAAGSAIALLLLVLIATAPALLRLAADPAGGDAVVGADQVSVRDDAFDPSVIEVTPGATVTWTFDDGGREHNVVGDDWSSDVVASGTYRHTFSTPGSYPYRCTLHWGMDGRVDVAQ